MLKMTPVVLKNFFSKSATRLYPKQVREPFEGYRGELTNNISDCIFCKACALKCPSSCITVDKKNATWQCNPFECVYCGICVETCPKHCLSQKTLYKKPHTEKINIFLKGEIIKKG